MLETHRRWQEVHFNVETEEKTMKSLGTDNQTPNIGKNLQQISRNDDMHMIQAAISINSEICI